MEKTHYTLLLLLAFVSCTFAQTSVMQDASGETAYNIGRNIITINATKEEVAFLVNTKGNEKEDWGIAGSFEAKYGTAKLIGGGKLQFNGSLGFQYFKNDTTEPGREDVGGFSIKHFNFGLKLLYSKISVYDEAAPYDEQIYSQSNVGVRAHIGYVWLKSVLGSFSVGVSGSGGIKDNTDQLDTDQITTVLSEQTNGDETRLHTRTEDVYLAPLINRSGSFGTFNFDIGHHLANDRLFLNLHFSHKLYEDIKPELSSAIGLFFIRAGAPLEAVAGIQLQTRDIADSSNSGLNFAAKSSLVLTVGFPF